MRDSALSPHIVLPGARILNTQSRSVLALGFEAIYLVVFLVRKRQTRVVALDLLDQIFRHKLVIQKVVEQLLLTAPLLPLLIGIKQLVGARDAGCSDILKVPGEYCPARVGQPLLENLQPFQFLLS